MVLIKKEPDNVGGQFMDAANKSSSAVSKEMRKSPVEEPNSRQPLREKPGNIQEQILDSESKKLLLSKFLITPQISPQVKKEAHVNGSIETVPSFTTKSKVEKPSSPNSAAAKRQKIKKTDDTPLKKPPTNAACLPAGPAVRQNVNKEPPKNPGQYEILDERLNEKDPVEDTEYYQDVFAQAEWRDDCIELAKYDMGEWVTMGQTLLAEQKQLMGRMIKARIDLSHRFEVITDIINERAQVLNTQGDALEAKLNKVQTLAKEILALL